MTHLITGSVFAGHRIDGVIGRGGMGVVYRARHLTLDRVVALKLITPDLAEDASFRERFARESRTAASLEHPNIVPVLDAGEFDGQLFIAMRYVDGDDLRAVISRAGALDPGRAAAIVGQVAAALDAAHARGLVHRDVKPANILIGAGDHAYLTDFGLTKHMSSLGGLTRTGEFVGSLDYVAPEQLRGDAVDARVDVYSLAGVLFHALTGSVPYPREGDVAKLWAHVREPPPPLTSLAPEAPPGLDEVVRRGMEKRPADRYPSAGDLGRAAEAAAAQQEVHQPERSVAAGAAAAPAGSAEAATAGGGAGNESAAATAALPPGTAVPTGTAATAAGAGRARARPRRRLLLAGGLVLLAGAGVAGAALRDRPPAPDRVARSQGPATPVLRVGATIPVGQRPNDVAVVDGGVWISSFRDPAIVRITPNAAPTGGTPVRVNTGTTAVATGRHSLWMTSWTAREVLRIDTRTNLVSRAEPLYLKRRRPTGLAYAAGKLYVVTRENRLMRFDPRSGELEADAVIPTSSQGRLAVAAGRVWLLDQGRGRVLSFDTDTLEQRRGVGVGGEPRELAVGRGLLWITDRRRDRVVAVDPRRGRMAGRRIRVGRGPEGIAVRGASAWVANGEDDTVAQIDLRRRAVVGQRVRVGREPFAVAAERRRVWVTNVGDNTVTRIDRR